MIPKNSSLNSHLENKSFIIPAIDIINGKCVRLTKGDYLKQKVYYEDPLEAAKSFEGAGLQRLHIVDLDGAKAGTIKNLNVLETICSNTNLIVDFGGGIKNINDISNVFNAWGIMRAMADLYAREITLTGFDSVVNHNIAIFPANAYRLYFTTNHDENSWNGTEFEKFGDAYKALAVFTQTMYQSVPLIYSGQEVPNKKRLKFFVKDPIQWNKFEMAPFYKTLLKLRKSTPALAADASYKKLTTANDVAIFAYLRKKEGRRVAVILNLSNQPQKFTIKDPDIYGQPANVFLGVKEKLFREHVYSIEPWGYIVYNYRD